MLERLNRSTGDSRGEDLLAVGRQFESGECVLRNEWRASQFYGQAARLGDPAGARRLALLFGTGRGVPQSYANAGAWLTGKGASDETIEPWDYSIGRAYTLIATALDRVRFPQDGWAAGQELSLVVEAEARSPGKLRWRFTGEGAAQAEAVRGPLMAAFDAAEAEAKAQLAPTDARYLVSARVTVPVTVRHQGEGRFVVTEHDPLLR
jgi:TPR repeat protein